MKEKKRAFFPILLKVILLGIIVSFIASTVAIVVNYNNSIKKAKSDLSQSANEALEYANTYFDGYSASIASKLASYEYVKNYVYNSYKNNENVRDAEVENYKTFTEYEDVFKSAMAFFYPVGMPGSQEYFNFKSAYNDINEVLLSASFYSEQDAFYAFKDPDNPDRFIFLCDSRHNTSVGKNVYYHCPGSHYDLTKSDKIFDIGHSYIKGYKLSKYETRFIELKTTDANTNEQVVVGYMFVAYETSQVEASFAPTLRNEILIMVVSGLAIIALYAVLSYFMFVKNINKLNKAAVGISNQLGSNQPFEVVNPGITSHDEMKTLSDSFVAMENQLSNYVDIIKADAREKEKINAELEIASRIQLEALPSRDFDDKNASIRAFIKPAKEVGGDFYDYFYISENEMVIIISDVSGKGVPAALFMMKSKELIKSMLHTHNDLISAIKGVNNALYHNNKESLFVTTFIGIINFNKNMITYVNAGHEKPYIVSNNKVVKLEGESNFVLGGIEDFDYKEETHAFNKGDFIFLFTDGLNESINKEKEEFSYSRVEQTLEDNKSESLSNIILNMNKNLEKFVGKEEQFDDVTMLVVQNKDNGLHLSYDKKDYSIITDIVNKFEQAFSYLPTEIKSPCGIVIDELVNNLISYETREDLKIDVDFKVVEDDLEIKITSNGNDYDPFANHKEKYLDKYHDEIEEGGFGLSIIKDLAKSYKYEYKNKHAIITVVLGKK